MSPAGASLDHSCGGPGLWILYDASHELYPPAQHVRQDSDRCIAFAEDSDLQCLPSVKGRGLEARSVRRRSLNILVTLS